MKYLEGSCKYGKMISFMLVESIFVGKGRLPFCQQSPSFEIYIGVLVYSNFEVLSQVALKRFDVENQIG